MKKVLITGATGYVGRRLTNHLLNKGDCQIRLFVRNRKKVSDLIKPGIEIYEGDTFNVQSLEKALQDIDVAYYLIHSMRGSKNFRELERKSAENFKNACIKMGVRRIIYLGGLGIKETASEHLLSRIETGEILSSEPEKIQTLWFRASIIIGSGSASFEILFDLVRKLPIMLTPKWVRTLTQPISVIDVIKYLDAAKDIEVTGNFVIDIGSEKMSFQEMIIRTSRILRLKRIIIPVPFLTPRLSSYWLILITRVPFDVASALVEGLRSETIVQNDNAKILFPHIKPVSFEDAVKIAIDELEESKVISRWCDSSKADACDLSIQQDISSAIYIDRRWRDISGINEEEVFKTVLGLGGENGWFNYNYLWKIRGMIDTLIGGYGTKRGRRDYNELRVGDTIDFWKVIDIIHNKRLLLFSEMKLPGKAWLEFVIDKNRLIMTAYYYPNGLFGILYWYILYPIHTLVFNDLIDSIIKDTKKRCGNE